MDVCITYVVKYSHQQVPIRGRTKYQLQYLQKVFQNMSRDIRKIP